MYQSVRRWSRKKGGGDWMEARLLFFLFYRVGSLSRPSTSLRSNFFSEPWLRVDPRAEKKRRPRAIPSGRRSAAQWNCLIIGCGKKSADGAFIFLSTGEQINGFVVERKCLSNFFLFLSSSSSLAIEFSVLMQ